MIEVRALAFGFRGQPPLLENLDHTFDVGSTTAVIGPSGRGKSTLLYLLGLMLRPRAGSVVVDGIPVSGLADRERSRLRASHIGFVFQDALLDPAVSVLDNVLEGVVYGDGADLATVGRAHRLLEELAVDHRRDHLPGQISGGQAQRVALCRALVKDPAVVLADEPSGNLDTGSADVVWSALHAHASRGRTVVVATHDLDRAKTCDARLEL